MTEETKPSSRWSSLTAYKYKIGFGALLALTGLMLSVAFFCDCELEVFDVKQAALKLGDPNPEKQVPGVVTTAALVNVVEGILGKRCGYLANDKTPPFVFMDNVPNWEWGVVVQVRDLARFMRNDFSRSQSQSLEDPDLAVADPQFSIDHTSWLVPSAEGEYQIGIKHLKNYFKRLQDHSNPEARFFARSDSLQGYLGTVARRLGDLAQRLGDSVGEGALAIPKVPAVENGQSPQPAGDRPLTPVPAPNTPMGRTPWYQVDDIFYEARGASWALLHFLRAVEIDFQQILESKHARESLRQVVKELEATQDTLWSPIVLNGKGLGLFANHSLVMASYISRANAALVDLIYLLRVG